MAFKLSKSKEGAGSRSKESVSKRSKSEEKGSKSKEKDSRSKKSGSKENGSKENLSSDAKKKKLRFWLIVAGILAIILILIVIGVTLFFVFANKSPVLCTSSICKEASMFLKKSSKFSVDPCDDFYEHVCGNYKGNTSITSERGSIMYDLKKVNVDNYKFVSAAKDQVSHIQTICKKTKGSKTKDIVNGDIARKGWPMIRDVSRVDVTDVLIMMLKVTSDVGLFQFAGFPTLDKETNQTRVLSILSPSKLLEEKEADLQQQFYLKSLDPKDVLKRRRPKGGIINWKKIARALNKNFYQSLYDPFKLDRFLERMLSKHKKEAFLNFLYLTWFRNNAYSPKMWEDPCKLMVFDLFPGALGFFHVYASIDFRTNDEIREMASVLRESAIEVVMESSWIDGMSKKEITYKLKMMNHYIGYDDLFEKIEELDKVYETLKYSKSASFFKIVQDVQKWETKMMYDVIGGTRKEKEFTLDLLDMNAKYAAFGNLLYVALGFFSFPSYHRDLPIYWNYGPTGFALGHEMGHAIGPMSHARDYTGIEVMKTSPMYISTMKRLTSCLAKYYSNRLHVNGTLTLEENSADVIGLRNSFRAMKKEVEKLDRDILLPGFETKTNEQMFFYSIAAGWCENEKIHKAHDVHAPSKARINGAFSLNEDFAKAFQCEKGTNMNPMDRCEYYGS